MIEPNKNINLITIIFLLFSFNTISNISQCQVTDFNSYSFKPDKEYIKSYLTATKKIVTGPVKWKKKQWIIAGSVAAIGITCYVFDDEIRQVFQSKQNNTLDFASKYVFEPWGSGLYPAVLFGGYYIYGIAADNKKARQIALGGTQAFIMAAISSQILKHIFHRHRPGEDSPPNPYLWDGPFSGWGNTSFPSGHTTTAFAMASLISTVYKDKIWIGVLSYGIATGVGISRIYDNEHWSTDVVIGAALGYAIGQTVYSIMANDSKFSMGISDNGGISIAYQID